MLRLKDGVRLTGLVPQMALAASVVDGVYQDFGIRECWITSANDGKHSDRSLHHGKQGKFTDGLCRALDFRTHQEALNGREYALRDEIKKHLGIDFDVVMEAVGTPNEHCHVEYDPK